jgi:hypothetical protein
MTGAPETVAGAVGVVVGHSGPQFGLHPLGDLAAPGAGVLHEVTHDVDDRVLVVAARQVGGAQRAHGDEVRVGRVLAHVDGAEAEVGRDAGLGGSRPVGGDLHGDLRQRPGERGGGDLGGGHDVLTSCGGDGALRERGRTRTGDPCASRSIAWFQPSDPTRTSRLTFPGGAALPGPSVPLCGASGTASGFPDLFRGR